MEIQLQELIDQIKKDGVEAAETQASSILDSAKAEAEKIIADAQARAEKMLLDGKAENERMVRSSEDAIRQAGRNLLISFRESVARELKAIINENVTSVYSSGALDELIMNALQCYASKSGAEDLSVILNSKDLDALENALLSELKEKMLSGVTLKADDNFDGGFRIAVNSDGAYYDYSAQAVVDMLSGYLSPRVTALLKEAE